MRWEVTLARPELRKVVIVRILYRIGAALGREDDVEGLVRTSVEAGDAAWAAKYLRRRVEDGQERWCLLLADVLADQLGDRTEADVYYRRALADGSQAAYARYGLFLREDPNRRVEAETMLRRGGELIGLGVLYAREGRDEDAIEVLLQANDEDALPHLALAELRTGDVAAAIRYAAEAVQNYVPAGFLALAEIAAEHPALTVEILGYEVDIDKQYREAVYEEVDGAAMSYATWLLANGRVDDVRALYEEAVYDESLRPDELDALRALYT